MLVSNRVTNAMATKVQAWIRESREQVTLNELSDDKNVAVEARERRERLRNINGNDEQWINHM